MLFGYIEDEKYVDLIDENGKLFKRFNTHAECNSWLDLYADESDSLRGLIIQDTVVKWYDSNRQWFKIFLPIVAIVMMVIYA